MNELELVAFARQRVELLRHKDPVLYDLLEREHHRQVNLRPLVGEVH